MADLEIELASISISISTPPAPLHDAFASTSAATSLEDDSCGYDVFINHRGPNVKNTFASRLYRRLLQRGLRVFLDKPELQEVLNLTLQIQRAIRTASVHVGIFSPTYSQPKWCLDELLQMFESEAIIIPVFYHMKLLSCGGRRAKVEFTHRTCCNWNRRKHMILKLIKRSRDTTPTPFKSGERLFLVLQK